MRIPHLIGAHIDIDASGFFNNDTLAIGTAVEPILLTFPFLGEFQEQLDAEGATTARPVKSTIAKAIEWLYRVKKWKLTITIPTGPGNEFAGVDVDLESAIADEMELLEVIAAFSDNSATTDSAAQALRFENTTFTTTSGDKTLSVNAYIDLFRIVTAGETNSPGAALAYQVGNCTDPSANQILVTMRVAISLSVYDTVTFEEWIATTDSWDSQEWDEYTDVNVAFDGYNYDTRWPWIGFSNGGSDYLESAPYVTIEPSEWWGYRDDSNNNPIWNESTGAQIRSVITGETI